MKRIAFILILIATCPVKAFCLPVRVYFSPEPVYVNTGENFTIDLMADIPQPVLGWGLDIQHGPELDYLGIFTYGSSWTPLSSRDSDRLAGLAPLNLVSGTEILLATLNFKWLGGNTSAEIFPQYTKGDLAEGFWLENFAFAEVELQSTTINPVPEPSTLLLLGIGIGSFAGMRKKILNRK